MSSIRKNEVYKTLGYRGVVEIMDAIAGGKHRFGEIALEARLNPNILDRCVRALTRIGVVEKRERVGYYFTRTGERIHEIGGMVDDAYRPYNARPRLRAKEK